MSLPALYLDEDIQSNALIEALRSRGMDVLTTAEAGMSHARDDEQLAFAATRKRVLLTFNIADFAKVHSRFLDSHGEHAGIILVQQQKWGPGELARRIIRVLTMVPGQSMRNQLLFISNW